jgi:hypothetical protein
MLSPCECWHRKCYMFEQYEDSKTILNNSKYKKKWKRYNHISICINYKSIFAQAAFDKFDGQDDVTSIIVNKKCLSWWVRLKLMLLIKKRSNIWIW